MKITEWQTILDIGAYSGTKEFDRVEIDIRDGIMGVVWPEGADSFTIHPQSGKKRGEGNGVKPIKLGFMELMVSRGWTEEHGRARGGGKGVMPGAFDAHLDFGPGSRLKPFVVEWETGNISSTHRAINRIALGILEKRVSGGVVIMPSAALAPYLTDRIGNFPEVQPYVPLWRKWESLAFPSYLALVAIEHDATSAAVPRIPKGTDGRSAS